MRRDPEGKKRRDLRRGAALFLDPLVTIINRNPIKVRAKLAWHVLRGRVQIHHLADHAQRAQDPNAPRGRMVIIPPRAKTA